MKSRWWSHHLIFRQQQKPTKNLEVLPSHLPSGYRFAMVLPSSTQQKLKKKHMEFHKIKKMGDLSDYMDCEWSIIWSVIIDNPWKSSMKSSTHPTSVHPGPSRLCDFHHWGDSQMGMENPIEKNGWALGPWDLNLWKHTYHPIITSSIVV